MCSVDSVDYLCLAQSALSGFLSVIIKYHSIHIWLLLISNTKITDAKFIYEFSFSTIWLWSP